MAVFCKDSPSFLKLTLDSILNQTLKASEVVIVKDGPLTDELENLLLSYKKSLVLVIITLKESQGLGVALRLGLDACKYQFVARIDSDDVCYPTRFEMQIHEFKKNSLLDIVGSFATEIDNKGTDKGVRIVPVENRLIHKFVWTCPVIHPSVMFKRKSIIKIGSYYPLRFRQDYDLWFRAVKYGLVFLNIPQTLIKYRNVRQNQKSRDLITAIKMVLIGLRGCWISNSNIIGYIGVFTPLFKAIVPRGCKPILDFVLLRIDPRKNDFS